MVKCEFLYYIFQQQPTVSVTVIRKSAATWMWRGMEATYQRLHAEEICCSCRHIYRRNETCI